MDPESSPFHFQSFDHPLNILHVLSQLYTDRHLCDVTLVVNGHEFPAHRVILAAGSPYFSAMFTNAHLESTQSHIILNDIEVSTLESILAYIYTAKLDITESNVQSLLGAASILQITSVVDACCEFLRVRLDPENCLGIFQYADLHGCSTLSEMSWHYTLEHFQEVAQSEEFLSITSTHLQALILSDNINVQSEEDVIDAVFSWYKHNTDKQHIDLNMPSLLQYIKLPLLPHGVLQKKLIDKFLPHDPIHQMISSQIKSFQDNHNHVGFNPYVPRPSISQRLLIYVVGGETHPGRRTINTVEEYNPAKDTWRQLTPMLSARRGVGVGILNGFLYAVGGSDSKDALQLVECYDPRTNTWTRVADLNESRSSVSAAVINGALYAIGGYDGFSRCLQSVEKYNPDTDTWSYVCEMNTPRSMSSVGIINNCLFIIGGYDGASDLASCEMYNPPTDKWLMISNMNSPRCMSGVGVVNGRLYAAGGCDCARSLCSAEVYDPEKDSWSLVADMSEPRSGVGMAVVGKKLFALGGYTGSVYCSSVECYDPDMNQWSIVSQMQAGRRRFGCCS